MLERFSDFLARKFPLPPPEERKQSFLTHKSWVGRHFALARDCDYLLLLLLKVFLGLGIVATLCVLVDAYVLSTNLLVDQQALDEDKRKLIHAYGWVVPLPAVLLTFVFYMRISQSFDLAKDPITLLDITNESFDEPERGKASTRIAVAFFAAFIGIGFSWLAPHGLIDYFDLQQNLAMVLFIHLLLSPATLAGGAAYFISGLLASKKAVHLSHHAENDTTDDDNAVDDRKANTSDRKVPESWRWPYGLSAAVAALMLFFGFSEYEGMEPLFMALLFLLMCWGMALPASWVWCLMMRFAARSQTPCRVYYRKSLAVILSVAALFWTLAAVAVLITP